jgi:hypothetical protein
MMTNTEELQLNTDSELRWGSGIPHNHRVSVKKSFIFSQGMQNSKETYHIKWYKTHNLCP